MHVYSLFTIEITDFPCFYYLLMILFTVTIWISVSTVCPVYFHKMNPIWWIQNHKYQLDYLIVGIISDLSININSALFRKHRTILPLLFLEYILWKESALYNIKFILFISHHSGISDSFLFARQYWLIVWRGGNVSQNVSLCCLDVTPMRDGLTCILSRGTRLQEGDRTLF